MTQISQSIFDACVEDLARRIDADTEKSLRQSWIDFYTADSPDAEIFTPTKRPPSPPQANWPDIHINDAIDDPRAMVLSQLKDCSDVLAAGRNQLLNVRCNYGTGILPSVFGCELYIMPRETHTLPTAKPRNGETAVKKLLDNGEVDINSALGKKAFDCAELFLQTLDKHDSLKNCVTLYHPDLQGPIDVVELVWGSEMFVAFYDQPQLMKDFLQMVTDTYAEFMRRWHRLAAPAADGYSCHWGLLINGQLMLRNDSLMNLSPEIYTDFIRPHDQRLLNEFGGGAIHYCGRGDHFISSMCEMDALTGINLSQPHLNDMEVIYANTVDKNIPLIPLARDTAEAAMTSGRKLRSRVCVL